MVLKGSVVRARRTGRCTLPVAESPAEFAPIGLSFFGRHVLPLLPHVTAFFRRERPEPLTRIANRLAFVRRQLAEPLEPVAQPLLIVGGHLPPLLEPLPCLGPLIGIHVRPLPRAVAQPLLTIRRQLIPALIEFLQQLLLDRKSTRLNSSHT